MSKLKHIQKQGGDVPDNLTDMPICYEVDKTATGGERRWDAHSIDARKFDAKDIEISITLNGTNVVIKPLDEPNSYLYDIYNLSYATRIFREATGNYNAYITAQAPSINPQAIFLSQDILTKGNTTIQQWNNIFKVKKRDGTFATISTSSSVGDVFSNYTSGQYRKRYLGNGILRKFFDKDNKEILSKRKFLSPDFKGEINSNDFKNFKLGVCPLKVTFPKSDLDVFNSSGAKQWSSNKLQFGSGFEFNPAENEINYTNRGLWLKGTGGNSIKQYVNNIASGLGSFSSGYMTEAKGGYSTALGHRVHAPSYGEVSVGLNGTNYTPVLQGNFSPNDRIFSVGNGSNSSNRSDALVIKKNGKVTLPSVSITDIDNIKSVTTKEYVDSKILITTKKVVVTNPTFNAQGLFPVTLLQSPGVGKMYDLGDITIRVETTTDFENGLEIKVDHLKFFHTKNYISMGATTKRPTYTFLSSLGLVQVNDNFTDPINQPVIATIKHSPESGQFNGKGTIVFWFTYSILDLN